MTEYLSSIAIATEVGKIDYRPGYVFTVFRHPFEGLCVRVELSVPNAYCKTGGGSEEQDQGLNIPVPPIVSAEHFHDFMKWRLGRFELHELNEFYWVDGHVLHDPHSSGYWKLRA